jgi:hypothetical protein
VSTHDQQTIPLQIRALQEYGARRGWRIALQAKEIGSDASENAIFKSLRMKLRLLCVKLVATAALTLTAQWVCAQDGLEGAFSRANLASQAKLEAPFSQTLAAADFDGDNKPDGAILVDHGWRWPQSSFRTIELHFTGRSNTDLTFASNEATLAISALDVNRDGAVDIVVEQPFTHKRLQVWLNDGRGGFREVRREDFLFADVGDRDQLGSPSQRPDCQALCLSPHRDCEIAILGACLSPRSSSSAHEQALPLGSLIGSRAGAPNSPRAPPLS